MLAARAFFLSGGLHSVVCSARPRAERVQDMRGGVIAAGMPLPPSMAPAALVHPCTSPLPRRTRPDDGAHAGLETAIVALHCAMRKEADILCPLHRTGKRYVMWRKDVGRSH